jgi:hypothetical protein
MTAAIPAASDPFGLWQTVIEPQAVVGDNLSFSLPGSDEEVVQGSLWRIDGAEDLQARASRVKALQLGLSEAEERLGDLIKSQQWQTGQVSFDIASLDTPEGRLFWSLEAVDPAKAVGEQAEVSFGLLDKLPIGPDWISLHARLAQLVESVNRQLLNFAWIETQIDNELVARTTINWGGNMTNVWSQQASEGRIELHRRSLAVAIQSRHTNLRAFTSVASMAGSLALAFTTPLGPARLMALAWQFISEVLGNTSKHT